MRPATLENLTRLILAGVLLFVVSFAQLACGEEPWKFIVVGDSRGSTNGVNAAVLQPLARRIADSHPDFVLFPGDVMVGSKKADTSKQYLQYWRTMMAPVYQAGIKVYPVAGNHEWNYDKLPAVWQLVFAELPGNGPPGEEKMTYAFYHKNAFVVGLDQYGAHKHQVNQAWLDQQLAARDSKKYPHLFVFGHEPAYAVHHKECLDAAAKARDAFMQSLADAGGRVYFCGHDHFYNHATIQGFRVNNEPVTLHQFVVGTGGAPIYKWEGQYAGNNGDGKTVAKICHDDRLGSYCEVEVRDLVVTVKYMQCDGDKYSTLDVCSYAAF